MTPAEIIAAVEEKFGGPNQVQEAGRGRPVLRDRAGRPAGNLRLPARRAAAEVRDAQLHLAASITSSRTRRKLPRPASSRTPRLSTISPALLYRHRTVLKILLPRWKNDKPGELPEVPSVVSLWRGADWHEREVYDLSGIIFTGHPGLTRILLSEDWIGHPLRKDYEFPLEYHGIRGR